MNVLDSAIVATLNQYRLGCLMMAAVDLGLFEELDAGPRSAEEIALSPERPTQWSVDHLERLLVGLELMGFVAEADGKWSLTEVGKRFTAEDSILSEHMRLAKSYLRAWSFLPFSVEWGAAGYAGAFGCSVWEDRRVRPPLHAAFTKVMRLHAEQAVDLILKAEVLDDEGSVVDIAGGEGLILMGLLLSRPKLRGHLVELPEMVARARDLPGIHHVLARLTLTEGQLFSLPSLPAEPFLLVNVLHDWNDTLATAILEECRKHASKIIIVERLVDPGNRKATALHDLHMMAVTGGKQRTVAQMDALLKSANWSLKRVIPSDSLSLVEAV